MMWWDGAGWWMLFGGLWMLVFWGGIIFLVIWGIRKLSERGGSSPGGRSPRTVPPPPIPATSPAPTRGATMGASGTPLKGGCRP